MDQGPAFEEAPYTYASATTGTRPSLRQKTEALGKKKNDLNNDSQRDRIRAGSLVRAVNVNGNTKAKAPLQQLKAVVTATAMAVDAATRAL